MKMKIFSAAIFFASLAATPGVAFDLKFSNSVSGHTASGISSCGGVSCSARVVSDAAADLKKRPDYKTAARHLEKVAKEAKRCVDTCNMDRYDKAFDKAYKYISTHKKEEIRALKPILDEMGKNGPQEPIGSIGIRG